MTDESSYVTVRDEGLVPFDYASDLLPDGLYNFCPGTGDLGLVVIGHAGDVVRDDPRVANDDLPRSI